MRKVVHRREFHAMRFTLPHHQSILSGSSGVSLCPDPEVIGLGHKGVIDISKDRDEFRSDLMWLIGIAVTVTCSVFF